MKNLEECIKSVVLTQLYTLSGFSCQRFFRLCFLYMIVQSNQHPVKTKSLCIGENNYGWLC